jgi:predicted dehydrogenase
MRKVNKPVRFLLVGVGQRGKQWAQVVHREPDARLAACVDTEPAHLDWAATQVGMTPELLFSELPAALDAVEADVVILAIPPMIRYEYGLMVVERGLPIIAEKPLTVDFAESIDLSRRAAAAGLSLVSGFNFRYLNVTQTAKRLLASGELGAPGMARYIYWLHRDGMKPGGNRYPLWMDHPMLLEQTIHHLDLFRYTYSSEVKWLWCKTQNPPWSRYDHDATAIAVLELENGLVVNYCGTWMGQSLVREFEWRTDYSDGALLQTDIYSDLFMARPGEDQWQRVDVPPDQAYIDDTHTLLKGVIADLAAGRPLQPSAGDNLRTLALVFACIESSQTGERIEMEAFYRRHGLQPHELAIDSCQ